jgi:hypothetical protein
MTSKVALKKWMKCPGVPGILFCLTMVIFVIYPVTQSFFLRDGDSSWLIKTGLYILGHTQLPREDFIFGNEIQQDWILYQWGFEVLVGLAYQWAGFNGVVFFCALIIAATILLICYWLFDRGFHGPSVAFAALVSFVALLLYSAVRPFIMTNLFTVLLLYLLGKTSLRPSLRLILIPPLFLLWSNLHLGFTVGFFILILFIGFDLPKSTKKERLFHFMTLGLSFLATGVNPYGFGLYSYLFQLTQSPEMMASISELQSINFHHIPYLLFQILFIVAALVYVRSDHRLTETHYLFLLIGLGLALYSLRNYYLFVLASAPLAAAFFERVSATLPVLGRDHKYHPWWKGNPAWIIVVTLLVSGLVTQAGIHSFRFSEKRFPVEAVKILKDYPPTGTTFTRGQWGSYLAWDPEGHRALIDSRFDMYGDVYFKTFHEVYDLRRDWRPFFAEYNVRYVLIPPESTLSRVLLNDHETDWEILYQDSQAILFQQLDR